MLLKRIFSVIFPPIEFVKGKLYIRVLSGKPKLLFYPDEDVQFNYRSFQTQDLVQMLWGDSKPHFGGGTDFAHHGEQIGSRVLVEFREAGDDDIRAIFDNWSEQHGIPTIAEFSDEVQRQCNDLLANEKDRIARIAGNYQ